MNLLNSKAIFIDGFFMYNEMEVMNMIYITGDTHGNQFKWLEQIDPILKEGDIIIVCGDFGIGFFQQKYSSEESFYDFISEQPYTVLFIDAIMKTLIYLIVIK